MPTDTRIRLAGIGFIVVVVVLVGFVAALYLVPLDRPAPQPVRVPAGEVGSGLDLPLNGGQR
jgi:hypothetical protein